MFKFSDNHSANSRKGHGGSRQGIWSEEACNKLIILVRDHFREFSRRADFYAFCVEKLSYLVSNVYEV